MNETISKKVNFWKLPKSLIIFFKRYDNQGSKLENFINFPLQNLDMSKYVVGYDREQYKYDLYGVSNHVGNTMGGHYFAFVKNNDDKWYKFNDNIVTTLHIDKVITNMAYCLFYKLKE